MSGASDVCSGVTFEPAIKSGLSRAQETMLLVAGACLSCYSYHVATVVLSYKLKLFPTSNKADTLFAQSVSRLARPQLCLLTS